MKRIIITCLIVLLPLVSYGAILNNDGSNQNVNFGSGTSLDGYTAHTLIMWIYPVTINGTLGRMLASKETTPATFQKNWTIRSTGQLDSTFNTSGTTATARSASSAGNVITTGKWWYVAFTLSSGLVPRIYIGDLSTPAKEVAYTIQTTGTGTADDDSAADFILGNTQALNRAGNNRYAFVSYYNRELSLGEIRSLQYRPRVISGTVLFSHLGFNGLTSAPDWSGKKNNGTILATTTARHVPLGNLFGI